MKKCIFTLISFTIFSLTLSPLIASAAIRVCVVPDELTVSSNECIFYSKLDGWLRSKSIHDTSGNLIDDVFVEFKSGIFRISTPMHIDRQVTGNGRRLLTLYGSADGTTIFSGARPLKFKNVPESYRKIKNLPDGLLVANLRDSAIVLVPPFVDRRFGKGGPVELELFYKGKPMPIARWPNDGFAKTGSVGGAGTRVAFNVIGKDLASYRDEKDLRAGGYFQHDWAFEMFKVSSIDSAGMVVLYGKPPTFGVVANRRVWFENALTDIDMPGEWHIDHTAGLLYFMPPEKLTDGDAEASYALKGIELNGATNVTLKNITVTGFRNVGVEMTNVKFVTLQHSIVRNIGSGGVTVKGTDSGLLDVKVENIGGTGIALNGGDRKYLIPGNLFARRCDVTNVGRIYKTYAPAVFLMGVGNILSDSKLTWGPHAGIIFHGNNHSITRNLIEDFVKDTDDAGAIYTGQDWTEQGTIIEGNIIRNIGKPGIKFGAKGVYLDDQASGISVKNNLFVNVKQAVFIGGGRDNTVSNNVFAESKDGILLDARGLNNLKKNGSAANSKYLEKTNYYNISKPPYSLYYPHLAIIENDQPGAPKYNVADDNIFFGSCKAVINTKALDGITIKDSLSLPLNYLPMIKDVEVKSLPKLIKTLKRVSKPLGDDGIRIYE